MVPLLRVQDIYMSFKGVKALQGVSFDVDREVLSIIGPNGSGKTTLLNCISGFYHPQKGQILFEGCDITHLPPHKIAALGIGRTFQNTALFEGLTVLENIMLGAHVYMRSNFISSGIYFGLAQKEEVRIREFVEEIIDFLEIEEIRKVPVRTLPLGLRRRIELGRALALQPKILLLDEPFSGLNVEEKEDMVRFIIETHKEKGIPIVLVSHDMDVVMDISDRIVVLNYGVKIAEGKPSEIQKDPKVIEAYVGQRSWYEA